MDELTRDLNSMIHEQARHDLLGESLTEARSAKAIIRGLAVTIDEMETDPGYRNGEAVTGNSAKAYISNLTAHAKEIEALDKKVARSIRVTMGDMKADMGRRGEIGTDGFRSYISNLKADLARLQKAESVDPSEEDLHEERPERSGAVKVSMKSKPEEEDDDDDEMDESALLDRVGAELVLEAKGIKVGTHLIYKGTDYTVSKVTKKDDGTLGLEAQLKGTKELRSRVRFTYDPSKPSGERLSKPSKMMASADLLDAVGIDLLSEAMERIRVTNVEISLEPPDDYDNDFGMDFYVTFEMNERMIAKLLGRQLRVMPKVMKDSKTPKLLQRAIENNNDLLRQIRSAVAHEANAYALETYDKRAAIDDISWSESWDMTVKLKGDKAVVQGEVTCLGSWR